MCSSKSKFVHRPMSSHTSSPLSHCKGILSHFMQQARIVIRENKKHVKLSNLMYSIGLLHAHYNYLVYSSMNCCTAVLCTYKLFKMTAGRHLGWDPTGSSAVPSTIRQPRKPRIEVEPNMKWIG